VALAFLVRFRAIEFLETDYDEDDYLRAGQLYAQHIAAGDLAGIINERENYEHPPLTKLLYGLILYFQSPDSYAQPVTLPTTNEVGPPEIALKAHALRVSQALLGALTAGLVALVNPLAGLLVALNSWHIKYTSQAMLEALPCFLAALTLLLLYRSRRNGDGWWWAAAVALGLTAAGKYLYAVGGVAAIIWFLGRDRRSWRLALAWGGVALLTFYLADPALWPNPVGRLWESLTFNVNFSTGNIVQTSSFGWGQPAIWLLAAIPFPPAKHPEIFPLMLDGVFSIFGLLAIKQIWRDPHQRLIGWWFGVNMLFLFFWPTKWPQYILAVTVPISIMAAVWLQKWRYKTYHAWQTWRSDKSGRRAWKAAWPWLLPSLIVFAVIVVYPILLQTALATTNFEIPNLREGAGGVFGAAGRGLIGLPADKLVYVGTAPIFGLMMWEQFFPTLGFNILWTVVTMALATLFGLWLATRLQRSGLWGKSLWRTLFILPWAIPEFVAALIWSTLFDDINGGINNFTSATIDSQGRLIIKWLTEPNPIIDFKGLVSPLVKWLNQVHLNPIGEPLNFLASSLSVTPAFVVTVLVGVWVAFPFMMMVSTVALRAIPAEIYDAARVDGGQGWALWRGITWPMIEPTIWSGVLLRGVLLFNAFQIPLVLLGGSSQNTGTFTLSLASYDAIRYENGYAIAALLNTVVLGLAAVLIWGFNRRTRVVEGVDYV
jgi:ABC-type sugar transport system permease subunit